MKKNDNTGFGLIKAVCERAQNENSNFRSALKKLTNSTEEDLKAFLEMKPVNKHLKRIYADKVFEIGPCDGIRTIANSKNLFHGKINLKKTNLNFKTKSHKTRLTKFEWFRLVSSLDFRNMINSFCEDVNKPDEVMFTQDQMLEITKKYLLDDELVFLDQRFFIPFKYLGEYFFAVIYVHPSGLMLDYYSYEVYSDYNDWPAKDGNYLIIPTIDDFTLLVEHYFKIMS